MNNDLLGDILSRPPDGRPRYAPPTAKPDARPRRNSGPAIGVIPPGAVERAFIVGLYLACLALVVLSVLATPFYGLVQARRYARYYALSPTCAVPGTLGLALAIQAALTLTQYGARVMCPPRSALVGVVSAALAISVYYNIQAYYTPIAALANAYVAWLLIVSGRHHPRIHRGQAPRLRYNDGGTTWFMWLVAFVIVGFLWFWIVRPILEDWGVIAIRAAAIRS